jgi:hypothetical protein
MFKGTEKEKQVTAWIIEIANGDKIKTPGHNQLNGKLGEAAAGDEVKIEYLGYVENPKTGKVEMGYNVWIKKAKK